MARISNAYMGSSDEPSRSRGYLRTWGKMMFGRTTSERPHELSDARATVYRLGALLGSIGGFVTAGQFNSLFWQSIFYNLASAVLSIALISFVYELRLRKTVEAELLRLVGIEKSLAKHQLSAAGRAASVPWDDILNGASRFRVLMAEPGSWVRANWAGMVSGVKERPITIELFFPKPDGKWLPLIAEFHNVSEQELIDSVRRATEIAEQEWKAARKAKELSVGSKLSILYVDAFPTYSVVKADNRIITTTFPSTSRPPADNGFALAYEGAADAYPTSWFNTELERLTDKGFLRFEYEKAHENEEEAQL